jgi:hypothetical protein
MMGKYCAFHHHLDIFIFDGVYYISSSKALNPCSQVNGMQHVARRLPNRRVSFAYLVNPIWDLVDSEAIGYFYTT